MTRVLVVDDARLLAEVEGTPLERSNFEISVTAPTADIARVAEEVQPAVVILGEGESCPDALDVCRQLRANPATRAVGIIYIGMGLNRERAREAGADVFVPRPFTRLELREAFLRVLRLRDRIASRREVDLPVELQFGDELVRGVCRDLSLSGAFLVSERPLVPGEQGTLRLEVGGRLVELPVEVVREGPGTTGECGIGVTFVGLDPDLGVYLSRFVRTMPSRRPEGATDTAEPRGVRLRNLQTVILPPRSNGGGDASKG